MAKDGDYAGVVLRELKNSWRVEMFDAFMLVAGGLFSESGEIRDFPKSDVRVFNDLGALGQAIVNILQEKHPEWFERKSRAKTQLPAATSAGRN
jgi:hypothetical protein